MLSLEEIQGLSVMNWELEKMIRDKAPGTDGKPMLSLSDIYMARSFIRLYHSVRRSSKPKPSTLPFTMQDIQVSVRDGSVVPARKYTPRKPPADGCPCIYVCHGGGYVLGELDGEDWLCELFASMGGIAIDVLYRHAPEYPFPVPVQDSYDGLTWVAQNSGALGINPVKGFILAGLSTGGDIALIIAQLYAEEQPLSPALTGIYVGCPMVMNKETVPDRYKDYYISMEQNAKAPLLTTESVNFILSVYKPDLTSPLTLPILFPNHQRWPKTYLQVCGLDPLRDGGLILEQVLKDSGVEVKTDVYSGLPHCFWGAFIHADFTKKHRTDTAAGLGWLLNR